MGCHWHLSPVTTHCHSPSLPVADTLIMPDEGKLQVAKWWQGLGPDAADQIELHLFKNTPAMTAALTLTDMVDTTFVGYAAKLKAYSDFSNPAIVGGKARTQFGGALQTFTCTGAGAQVTGWYLLDTNSGKILFACLYDVAVTMINGAQHRVDVYIDTDIA
jgi:hypothetical protein